MRIDKQMDDFLDGVQGLCEANSYEQHSLWGENDREGRFTWVQENFGLLPTIGRVGKRPVVLSLFICVIKGYRICFYHATSQIVDHLIVDEWLKKAMPPSAHRRDGFLNKTDAMNFINVIHELDYQHKAVDKVSA
jgi:hypothetical protein